MNKFIVTLEKCNSILILPGEIKNENYPEPRTLAEILGKCGYALSTDLQGWISPEYETKIIENLGDWLDERFGIGKTWKTVYSSPLEKLPGRTQKSDQALIYANPENFDKVRRGDDFWEKNNYKVTKILGKAEEKDMIEEISKLLKSQIPLGNQDNLFLDYILTEDIELRWPEKIECKEILARVLSKGKGEECISGINDILRTVTYLSYQDTTLQVKDKIKLRSKERKIIIRLLDSYIEKGELKFKLWDAKRYYWKWRIVARVLHHKNKFFDVLCGKDRSWMKGNWYSILQRRIDEAVDSGSFVKVIEWLSTREGELLRRFDSVLRRAWSNKDSEGVSEIQSKLLTIRDVRPKTLLQLYKYYDLRNLGIKRSFVDKMGTRIFYDPLPQLDDDLRLLTQNMIISKLKNLWKEDQSLRGRKVYIDLPEGCDYALSNRSGSLDSVFPGTKVKFEKKGILRFFSQWIDPKGKYDLDLHALFLKEDGETTKISWNTKFSDGNVINHSGDVRNVPGNCAEYVSVNFDREVPYKYLLVLVQNFNSEKLSEIENYLGIARAYKGDPKELHPDENNTIFRTRVITEARNIVGFLVNLKEGIIRFIMEGVQGYDRILNSPEVFLQYIQRFSENGSLDLRTLVEYYVEAKGGIIVNEVPEEDLEENFMMITEEDIKNGELMTLILE